MIEKDTLEYAFSIFMRLHHQRMHQVFAKIGVYPGQPHVLLILHKYPGLTQKELAEKMIIKPATMTVALQRMEKNGLVERKEDDQDRRISRVFLTRYGEQMFEQSCEIFEGLYKEMFQSFTSEEKMLLRRLMLQMVDNLSQVIQEDAEKNKKERGWLDD